MTKDGLRVTLRWPSRVVIVKSHGGQSMCRYAIASAPPTLRVLKRTSSRGAARKQLRAEGYVRGRGGIWQR